MTLRKNIKEIIEYRELIKTFVIRNLKTRYKGSVLGYMWTWLDPLITMLIFIFIFDIILKIKVENFPVYLLSGLLPWIFFSGAVSASVNSMVGNATLIKSIYFPRAIYPLSVVLSNLVNFLLSLIVLIPIILLFKLNITYKALFLPFPLILMFFFALGLALLFSCLNVYFRDISYISGFILRLWFYASPIFYSIEDKVSERFLDLYLLNPLAVIVMLFRTSLMGLASPNIRAVLIASFVCIFTFVAGLWLFIEKEDKMVKRI